MAGADHFRIYAETMPVRLNMGRDGFAVMVPPMWASTYTFQAGMFASQAVDTGGNVFVHTEGETPPTRHTPGPPIDDCWLDLGMPFLHG